MMEKRGCEGPAMRERLGMRIVLPGGSGQIGQILAAHFHEKGDDVTVIARNPNLRAPWRSISWDGRKLGPWADAFDDADLVINLAGRSVNCRYTAENSRIIKESRTETTRLVGQAIANAARPPPLWMNASTATIYRHTFDRAMDEATGELGGSEPNAPRTWRFSIDVAKSWEDAFFEAVAPQTRKIALRCAIVMSPQRGGTFDILVGLVRRGLGGTMGSGKQFFSWVHDADLCRAIDFLVARDELAGIVNISAPHPLPNREFMRILRDAWGARIGLPATEWMLEVGTFFMRSESELVLKSRRVIPTRLLEAGFTFEFPNWPEAAADLTRRWRATPTEALK
jgi:uncharacterized protein (TIGR01777 family)